MVPLTSERLCAALRPRLDGALLALDYDGTLAPIVADPQDARPLPGTVAALTDLAGRGAHIAIVTGRDAATAVRLGGLDAVPGLVVAGLYGAQTWRGGNLDSPAEPAAITALRRLLPEAVAVEPLLWIEDKGLSLVVHARRAADPAAALAAVTPAVTALATGWGLRTHPGRHVLEVRLPGFDKAGAVRALLTGGAPTAVLYAGDDVGDVPAFALVRELRARRHARVGASAPRRRRRRR